MARWFEMLAQVFPLHTRSPRQPASGLNFGESACASVAVEAPRHVSFTDTHLRGKAQNPPHSTHHASSCLSLQVPLESQCRTTKNRCSTVTDFANSSTEPRGAQEIRTVTLSVDSP